MRVTKAGVKFALLLAAGGALLCCVIGITWQGAVHVAHGDVHFLNGLDVPLHFSVNDESFTVDPQRRAERELTIGEHTIVCTDPTGRMIEELRVDVDGASTQSIYNPLGAAPLYMQRIVYVPDHSIRRSPDPELFVGREWVSFERVDHLFVQPSRTILGNPDELTTRTSVQLERGGWRTSLELLTAAGRADDAAQLARHVAAALPDHQEPLTRAVELTAAHGSESQLVALFQAHFEAQGEDVVGQRRVQAAFRIANRTVLLREPYEAWANADADSADRAYLATRLLPLSEAVPRHEQTLKREPEHTWSRRALGRCYYQQLRFGDALAHFAVLPPTDERFAMQNVEYRVRCLCALDRAEEALDIANGAAEALTPQDPFALSVLTLHARVRRLVGLGTTGPTPADLTRQLFGNAPRPEALLRVLALGGPGPATEAAIDAFGEAAYMRDWAALTIAARARPAHLPQLAARAAPDALETLPDWTRVALACELCRIGETDWAQAIHEGHTGLIRTQLPFDVVRDLSDLDALDEELDLDVRAVLEFAKVRRAKTDAERRHHAVRARRFDVLHAVTPR